MKNSIGFIVREKFDVEFNNISMQENVCLSADFLLSHVPGGTEGVYWNGIMPDKEGILETYNNSISQKSRWKFYFLSLEDVNDYEVICKIGASGDGSLQFDMLSDIRPDDVPIKFCGFEVLDSCFSSAHYRFGFCRSSIANEFSPFLLENGLFKSIESALAFRRICDVVVEEHSPFIVVRIEELLFQEGDIFPPTE